MNDAMQKSTKLVALGAALVLSGIFVTALSGSSRVSAQEQKIDLDKLKQLLNETRNAIEANDDPGALTQLDLVDQMLGIGNTTTTGNMTNTTAIVTG